MKATLQVFFTKCSHYGRLAIAVLLTIMLTTVSAQEQSFRDSWGQQGLSLTRQGTQGVNLNFSIQHFSFTERDVNGQTMTGIEFSESLLPAEAGMPDVPGYSRYIAIPNGATPVLQIVNMRTERYTNIDLAPAPVIPLDTDNGPLVYTKNTSVFSNNAFFPGDPARLENFTQLRGVDACLLTILPYQYNPVTKELVVYRDMEISITFEGGSQEFGENRLRSRWWDPILADAMLNFSSLPAVDYDARATESGRTVGYEYLIIVPNDPIFKQWADSIALFRNEEGIHTGIVKLSDIGNNVTPAMLETYINDIYNNWDVPPTAVLLLGDYGQSSANNNSITSPIWDNYCVSDNILSDVNNDDMPDIIFARITAQNAAQLQSMVGRFMKYERTPPTSAYFYANPITALGWQTERWFQICSETVGGFWKNVLGKTPVRINEVYQGAQNTWSTATNTNTVLGVFGPSGLGYIPASPTTLGGWSGGNATMINNALNAGSFMLMHRDHGMETGWGEPSYTNGNIGALTNTDLSFILSINCLTGKYNWSSESFTEKFHRYTYNNQPAGALGLIAASETSYSFVNDTYVWGMMDNMWPNFMPQYGTTPVSRGVLPAFGNAAGKYFLQQSNWPYNTSNKEVTYNLFHMHGDAFLRVCTEVPQTIVATYNQNIYEGETLFTITATPNSLVCLSENGQILGTGTTGLNTTIDINIPSQTAGTRIKVTITRPNCNRYEGWVDVIQMVTASVAGDNATLCEGTTHQLAGQATNYTGLLWETSGTGTFSDATILDPVYTPSAGDVTMGDVILSLTAINPATNDSTSSLTLSLVAVPAVFAGDAAEICDGDGYSAASATAVNYTGMEWISSGTGIFDDPTSLTPRYTPSAEDIAAGNVSLTLRAWNDVCAPVESVVAITIRPLPTPTIGGLNQICINQTGIEYTAATTTNTYVWEIAGGTITNGQTSSTATVTWDVAGEGVLVLTETNEFGCSQNIEYGVIVNPLPAPVIDGNALVCANSQLVVYSAPQVEGDNYEWMITGGEVVAGAGTHEISVNWGENGQGMLSLMQTNTATTCAAGAEYNVVINSPVITLGNDTTICITHLLNVMIDDNYASYSWSNGNTTNSIMINAAEQGVNSTSYALTVTDVNGCEGEASIMVTVDACAGIGENNTTTGISIFPNPSKGEFTLDIANAPIGHANLSVVNSAGEIVYANRLNITRSSQRENISLNIDSGVYFLKVETLNGVVTQKLVIK
ncbi:MAG: T9SS type A sorting domain-containing protein [Bacteroidales bacterium]|nr:T9SS type A sorting domain-containing protein [Bacteroidales bacterium]